MTPTTLVTPSPIQPAASEAAWSVVSAVLWIALIVATALVAYGLLNRWAGRGVAPQSSTG